VRLGTQVCVDVLVDFDGSHKNARILE
jgi:hypothetical protein